jgi:NADH:ubiquinone oxidoreductase subunit 2 (subunit N)
MQTLALPMILLNGWMVEGIETAPSAQELILRGALLVTVGFVLWLGIFPLHSWLPMLTEESHPWTVTFLLTIMQISLALFFLKFLNQYAWLRNIEGLDLMLRFIGVTSIFAAGTFGIFQKYLGRMLGYFFLAETGFILLAISYINQGGLEILQMSLLPRALSFLILGFTGSVLHQLTGTEEPEVDSLRGMIWKYPMTSLLLIFNSLNLIGLPLFMSFPYKNTLHNLLSSSNYALMIIMVLGSLGLLVLSLRIFSSLIHPQEQEDLPSLMLVDKEHPILIFTIVMIILLMVAGGIFPQLLSTPLGDLLQPFQNLIQ